MSIRKKIVTSSVKKISPSNKKTSTSFNKKLLETRLRRINTIQGKAPSINTLKTFYTKVFAYKLALKVNKTQKNLYYAGRPHSYKAVGASGKLIKTLSPTNPRYYRKSKYGGFVIIKGEISYKKNKGFNYKGISLKEANEFIKNHKHLVRNEKLVKLKPRMLFWIDKLVTKEASGWTKEKMELVARERVLQRELNEKKVMESRQKKVRLEVNELIKKRDRLAELKRFNERYGDFSDSKDLKNSIDLIQKKINSLNKNN